MSRPTARPTGIVPTSACVPRIVTTFRGLLPTTVRRQTRTTFTAGNGTFPTIPGYAKRAVYHEAAGVVESGGNHAPRDERLLREARVQQKR